MKTHGANDINLLNTGIDAFYNYEAKDVDDRKVIEFKAMFISFINQIERVFNGVFGKAFRMDDEEDIELFKELYPVIYAAASRNSGDEGIKKLCSILETFRNLNAHAYCECDYKKELDAKYILEQLPNYNQEVKYWTKNNIPTLAGMITLLLFLSNDKGIGLFVGNEIWNDFIDQLNYFGSDYKPNVYKFPIQMMEVNKINDEMEIRKPTLNIKPLYAMFGRFSDKITKDGDEYEYHNGIDDDDAYYHINFTVDKLEDDTYKIVVKKDSHYHIRFTKSYSLHVIDVDDFFEWCNKVPPFMFAVYLYRLGIKEYTKNSLTEEQKVMVSKLNRPKFYIDKNVDTLLLSSDVSDIRMGGQVTSIGVNYCLYMFELIIYRKYELTVNKYSILKNALAWVKAPEKVTNQIIALRNFFSHYHILGDYHLVGKEPVKIDLDFIIVAFIHFIDYLTEFDDFKARFVSDDFFYRALCPIILFKYSDLVSKTSRFLQTMDNDHFAALMKTAKRVERSFLTKHNEKQIKFMYPTRTVNIGHCEVSYLNKYVIESDKKIEFVNGSSFNGPITLFTTGRINLKDYIVSDSLDLVSEIREGFVAEKVFKI